MENLKLEELTQIELKSTNGGQLQVLKYIVGWIAGKAIDEVISYHPNIPSGPPTPLCVCDNA
jgi:hypothetical protein